MALRSRSELRTALFAARLLGLERRWVMKCSCGVDVAVGMKFCGGCGAKVEVAESGRGPLEVTGPWLKSVLEGEGFEVELDGSDSDQMVAKSSQRPNQVIHIRRDLGIVSLQSPWTMKKRRWGGKEGVLEAVNGANSNSWYSTFYANFDAERMTSSSFLQLTERLSEADVLTQLKRVEDDFFRALNSSGLSEHLA
jgi:hypothetical protein